MSLSTKIDYLLKSDEEIFDKVLKMLYMNNLNDTKRELDITYNFNQTLYESIEFTLKQLNKEEGFVSKILYKSFGLGRKKNKRRKYLLLLGSQLKTEITNLEKEIHRVNFHYKNSLSSLKALTDFSNGFGKKIHILESDNLINKCNQYLKSIYIKIDEVNIYTKKLDLKSIALEGSVDKYINLLKQIPRYQELKEEMFLEYKASNKK